MTRRRALPVVEGLGLLALTFPLAIVLHAPPLWLLVPLALLTLTRRSPERYGLTWEQPGKVRFHLAVSVGVFGIYLAGHYLFARWWYGAGFELRLPPDFASMVLNQILVIALPEEFFFRGYLQTQFDRGLGTPYRFLGVNWGWGLPLAAALFALCHVVYGGPVRLIVFFPGLFYGWLRAGTGTILVPVLYHAASNLLMALMLTSLSVG